MRLCDKNQSLKFDKQYGFFFQLLCQSNYYFYNILTSTLPRRNRLRRWAASVRGHEPGLFRTRSSSQKPARCPGQLARLETGRGRRRFCFHPLLPGCSCPTKQLRTPELNIKLIMISWSVELQNKFEVKCSPQSKNLRSAMSFLVKKVYFLMFRQTFTIRLIMNKSSSAIFSAYFNWFWFELLFILITIKL